MLKKFTCFILATILILCSLPVFASNDGATWKSLYELKMEEIISGYENGTKDTDGVINYGFTHPYFSVQDINFDGVPELYHALVNMFEHEPSVEGCEEIYYIKDGKLLQGRIEEGSNFCLIPMYVGRKAEAGDVTDSRWQFAMRNRETGEICFITNDSYSGFVDYPEITYSKLYFDITSGVLKSEVLLHRERGSYTKPVYLQGYDYVGADCYTSFSSNWNWGIDDWKPGYIAPKVVVNNKNLLFDVQPQIINNRTMVPLRTIFESLGADVLWDDTTNTVTAVKGDTTIIMTIGADFFIKNSEVVSLDSPAVIISGRTLVPVRAIAESLDCKVEWYDETRVVEILK